MRFGLLGSFEVLDDDGDLVDVGGPKPRAVLAMLCLDVGRVVPLDRIMHELWGEDPPPSAAGTVQSYVSNLRRALEPNRQPRTPPRLLISRAPGYVLDVPADDIDTERFRLAVERARAQIDHDPAAARDGLVAALSLWRGPALADFAYESFAQPDVERLAELRLAALEDRVEAELRLGNHAWAVAELEALVRDHPLRERMWGQLMIALYRSGRQADALRAYQRCATIIGEELGLVPGPLLRELEARVLAQDPTLDRSPSPAPPAAVPALHRHAAAPATTGLRLLGRDVEMSVVDAALDAALAGHGRVLLVEGEPGTGKSRLLEEAAAAARSRGFVTAISRCFEVGETPPFWPFVQLARGVRAAVGADAITRATGSRAGELAPLFPELGAPRHPDPPSLSPHRVADAMAHGLRGLTRDHRLLVGIDDVHAADPDSITMLLALTDALHDLGMVAIFTFRAEAVREEDHPLADAVAALGRSPLVTRLALTPLDVDAVAALIEQVTSQAVDPETAEAVHARTDGNPFFTVELSGLLAASGPLTPERVRQQAVVPGTVREVIGRRLARMPEPTLQLLRVAAVAGRTFDADVVSAVVGADVDAALDELDLAVACGTITEAGRPGRFRFAHVLVRDTIAASLNSLRLARLHQRLAAVIGETAGDDMNRLAAVAYHAVEARSVAGVEPAIAALEAAATAAADAGAFEGAAALHRRRIAIAAELAPGARDREELRALADLATVVVSHRGYQADELVPIHLRLAELAERSSPELAVQTAIGRWVFHTTRGELDDAEAVHGLLSRMLAGVPDPMAALVVEHSGGILALHRGEMARAHARFGRCAALLDVIDPGDTGAVTFPGLDQSVVVSHCNFTAVAAWLAGDDTASDAALQRGFAAAERGRRPYSQAFAHTFAAYLAAMRGDVDRALAEGRPAEALCERHGFSFLRHMVDVATGWARAARGEHDVVAQLVETDEHLVKGFAGGFTTVSWGLLVDAHARLGRVDAAVEILGRAIDFSDRSGELMWRPELERLAIELDEDVGRSGGREGAIALADRLGLVALRQRCETTAPRA